MIRPAPLLTLVWIALLQVGTDDLDDERQPISDVRSEASAMVRGLGRSVLAAVGVVVATVFLLNRREALFEVFLAVLRSSVLLARFSMRPNVLPAVVALAIFLALLGFHRIRSTGSAALFAYPMFISAQALFRFLRPSLRRWVVVMLEGESLMLGIAWGLFGLDGGLCWELRRFPSLYRNRIDGGYYQPGRRFWHWRQKTFSAKPTEDSQKTPIPKVPAYPPLTQERPSHAPGSFPVLAGEMKYVIRNERARDSRSGP